MVRMIRAERKVSQLIAVDAALGWGRDAATLTFAGPTGGSFGSLVVSASHSRYKQLQNERSRGRGA